MTTVALATDPMSLPQHSGSSHFGPHGSIADQSTDITHLCQVSVNRNRKNGE